MKHVVIFSDDTELRDMVEQLKDQSLLYAYMEQGKFYSVTYFATYLDIKQLPRDIDLVIFDLDTVSFSLFHKWKKFPRLHFPCLAIGSSNSINTFKDRLNLFDNYLIRPFADTMLQYRIDQIYKVMNVVGEFNYLGKYEMQNPLTSIQGFADVLVNMPDQISEDDALRFLNIIQSNAKYFKEIIFRAIDWARIEFQKNYHFDTISLSYIVEQIESKLEERVAKRNQILQIEVPDTTFQIYGDYGLIVFVILCLADNSLHYSDKNTKIRLSIARRNNDIVFEINDEGAGIRQEIQDKIFDKFVLDDLLLVDNRRTGLSLYLCKQIIEMHGGEIGFESELGVGTTFYFTLPLAE